ncbi:unnamed protein product [Brassica oleracea]|uniref:RRM domain-containing protein n=2 Tax=Brassica TaxID=3705 RepID=A0A3P6FF55_BRAOL|nr:unnamed protein product [Brassica napus]VDD45881.1 unnamed protein product [Brassica oleracea]
MVKYKKESVTKVEAAPASTKKPSKKSKRDAEVDLDIQNNPKKQKKELIQAEKKAPPPKKVETSNSSDSKKELKKDTDVEMAEAKQKSNAKQTQTNETPSTQARGGSNQLFAGNLSSKTKKSDLEKFFKGVGGEIKVVRLARGYAHVEFASVEAVQKALKLNGKPLLGRKIKLDDFNKNPAPRSSNADGNFQRGEGSQVKTILVKKNGKYVGEDEMKTALRDHFSACGEITRFAIPCDQDTGATKGMAFLGFINEDGFNKALELNGSELGGRNIVVTEASTRVQNGDRKSGRRQGRRRGRPLRQRRRDSFKKGPGKGNGETVEHPAKQAEAALDSKTKPSKKSKRDVEVDLDIPKDAKKQKKELIQAVEKAPPKKNNKKKKKKKKNANVEMAEAEQKPIAKQPKTLFAGRLPFHIEKSDLESFFKEVGEIKDVRLAKGIAHVEFASEEAAQKAMKLNGKPLLGRNILLDFANAKPAPRPRNLVKTIFVTGFNKSLSEDEMKTALRAHFSDCGEIKRISLPYYQETGDSKGVAYLDFSEDGFNKAMELNGSELGGRNIVVIEARPKEKNADRNSGDDSSKRGPGRGNG